MISRNLWSAYISSLMGVVLCMALPVAGQQTASHPAKKVPASAAHPAKRADEVRFESRVSAALDAAGAEKSFWGVLVADRDTGETVYELNADKFFTPASNAKIFTSSLAFATLGPDFRFRTTLETTARIDAAGKLDGDLVLVGRG
ncbi:MAG: D-alanyl-D-alanine carboxypeptidase, partial [Candidatus Acidiferrales bacterium]